MLDQDRRNRPTAPRALSDAQQLWFAVFGFDRIRQASYPGPELGSTQPGTGIWPMTAGKWRISTSTREREEGREGRAENVCENSADAMMADVLPYLTAGFPAPSVFAQTARRYAGNCGGGKRVECASLRSFANLTLMLEFEIESKCYYDATTAPFTA